MAPPSRAHPVVGREHHLLAVVWACLVTPGALGQPSNEDGTHCNRSHPVYGPNIANNGGIRPCWCELHCPPNTEKLGAGSVCGCPGIPIAVLNANPFAGSCDLGYCDGVPNYPGQMLPCPLVTDGGEFAGFCNASPTSSPTSPDPTVSPSVSPSLSPTTSNPTTSPTCIHPGCDWDQERLDGCQGLATEFGNGIGRSLCETDTETQQLCPCTCCNYTFAPTLSPTATPTAPTTAPTTSMPTTGPTTSSPTAAPASSTPTAKPTAGPIASPLTATTFTEEEGAKINLIVPIVAGGFALLCCVGVAFRYRRNREASVLRRATGNQNCEVANTTDTFGFAFQ